MLRHLTKQAGRALVIPPPQALCCLLCSLLRPTAPVSLSRLIRLAWLQGEDIRAHIRMVGASTAHRSAHLQIWPRL